MKLALFRDAGNPSDTPRPIGEWADGMAAYVRVSDFVDVTFPSVTNGPTDADIRAIDERIGKAQAILTALTAQKNELLAITHEVQA